MITTVLLLASMALSLMVAGVGYRVGQVKGRALLGVTTAAGFIVLASVTCSALPDSAKSERQIADEAAACLQAGYGEEFAILFPNGKDGIADTLVQTSSREQLVTYRDQKCGKGIEDPASVVSDSGSGLENPLRSSNSGCTGCSSIQEMMDEYDANPLRAESRYKGRTMVVGGKIQSISGGIGAPLLVRLKNDTVLDFDKKQDTGWLLAKNIGDDIEAQCRVVGFHWKGHPNLSDCGQVPE